MRTVGVAIGEDGHDQVADDLARSVLRDGYLAVGVGPSIPHVDWRNYGSKLARYTGNDMIRKWQARQ